MKHNFIKTSTCLALSLLLFFTACQKKVDLAYEETPSLQNFVNDAKAFFTNGPLLTEKNMLDLPFSVLPENDPKRLYARMGRLESRLIWDDAQLYNREGLVYLIVPVEKNKKYISKEVEIEKAILFYKNKGESLKMNVVEVVGKKGESIELKSKEIMAKAAINMLTKSHESIGDINAHFYFYDDAYQSLSSYEIKNGAWSISNSRIWSEKNKVENPNTNSTENAPIPCETYHVVQLFYNAEGEIIWYNILYTYQVCNGQIPPDEPINGGGGGNGGGINENTISILKDEAQYVEQDEQIGNSGYVKIKYTYNATISRSVPGNAIVGIVVHPTMASPIQAIYIDKYNRNVTRKLTLFNHVNSWFYLTAVSAMVNWSCTVHALYQYTDGTPSFSRQWTNTRSSLTN